MAQLMPLPLTVSCFSKIQIGFTFLVPADPGSPRQKAVKRVCVCVVWHGHGFRKYDNDWVKMHEMLVEGGGLRDRPPQSDVIEKDGWA